MTLDEAMAILKLRCEQRLAHLGVVTTLNDLGFVGVALKSPGPARHAVALLPQDVLSDPVGEADDASDAILASLARQAA